MPEEKVEVMPEVQPETKTETQQTERQNWDKEKQRADQAEANYRKTAKQLEDFKENFYATTQAIDDLKSQITSLTEKRQEAKEEIAELDENVSDPSLVRYVKRLNEQIKKAQGDLAVAQGKISQYEQAELTKLENQKREAAKEEVLSFCDDEYGAKYRSKANKLADQLVDDGIEPQPKNVTQAIKLLRKCYKQVIADEEKTAKSDKKKTSTDSGQGGVSFDFGGDDIKEGTLDEVASQLAKKFKK